MLPELPVFLMAEEEAFFAAMAMVRLSGLRTGLDCKGVSFVVACHHSGTLPCYSLRWCATADAVCRVCKWRQRWLNVATFPRYQSAGLPPLEEHAVSDGFKGGFALKGGSEGPLNQRILKENQEEWCFIARMYDKIHTYIVKSIIQKNNQKTSTKTLSLSLPWQLTKLGRFFRAESRRILSHLAEVAGLCRQQLHRGSTGGSSDDLVNWGGHNMSQLGSRPMTPKSVCCITWRSEPT